MKFNKKVVGSLLCASILLSNSLVSAASFSDVTRESVWAYDYIIELADQDIIKGYPDGTYKPFGNISFLETIALLNGIVKPSEAETKQAYENQKDFLKNYPDADWAYNQLAVFLERKIISREEIETASRANMLKRENPAYINRINVAQLFARAMNLSEESVGLLDVSDINDVPASARGNIAALVKAGVLHPRGREGKFEPYAAITRAEMAKMVSTANKYVKNNPISTKEITEKGIFQTYANVAGTGNLLYNIGNDKKAVAINSSTIIQNKDKQNLNINDLSKYSGAEVEVTYQELTSGKVAKSIRFLSDGEFKDGEYTFVSSRTSANKNYITIKDKNYEKEYEFKDSYIKNGNSYVLLQDIKKDTILNIKFENNAIKEASVKNVQSGQYRVERKETRNGIDYISVTPSNGGAVRTYSVYRDTPVIRGNSNSTFSSILPGETVDLSFKYTDVIDRIVVYSGNESVNGSYTFKEIWNNTLFVIENRTGRTKEYRIYDNSVFIEPAYRDSLRNGDQLELSVDSYDRLLSVRLTSKSAFGNGILANFKNNYRNNELLIFDENNRFSRVYPESQRIKLFEDGREISLSRVGTDGIASVVYDTSGNILEIHFNTKRTDERRGKITRITRDYDYITINITLEKLGSLPSRNVTYRYPSNFDWNELTYKEGETVRVYMVNDKVSSLYRY